MFYTYWILSVYRISLPDSTPIQLKDKKLHGEWSLAFDAFSKTKEGNLHLHGVFGIKCLQ